MKIPLIIYADIMTLFLLIYAKKSSTTKINKHTAS